MTKVLGSMQNGGICFNGETQSGTRVNAHCSAIDLASPQSTAMPMFNTPVLQGSQWARAAGADNQFGLRCAVNVTGIVACKFGETDFPNLNDSFGIGNVADIIVKAGTEFCALNRPRTQASCLIIRANGQHTRTAIFDLANENDTQAIWRRGAKKAVVGFYGHCHIYPRPIGVAGVVSCMQEQWSTRRTFERANDGHIEQRVLSELPSLFGAIRERRLHYVDAVQLVSAGNSLSYASGSIFGPDNQLRMVSALNSTGGLVTWTPQAGAAVTAGGHRLRNADGSTIAMPRVTNLLEVSSGDSSLICGTYISGNNPEAIGCWSNRTYANGQMNVISMGPAVVSGRTRYVAAAAGTQQDNGRICIATPVSVGGINRTTLSCGQLSINGYTEDSNVSLVGLANGIMAHHRLEFFDSPIDTVCVTFANSDMQCRDTFPGRLDRSADTESGRAAIVLEREFRSRGYTQLFPASFGQTEGSNGKRAICLAAHRGDVNGAVAYGCANIVYSGRNFIGVENPRLSEYQTGGLSLLIRPNSTAYRESANGRLQPWSKFPFFN